ncbi:MAG: M48 family metalloprotease [Terriglobales bacterium]
MIAPATTVAPLSPAELARARDYLYGDLLWGTVAQLWLLAVLAWTFFSGASRRARAGLAARWRRRWAVVAGVQVGLFVLVLALELPWDFYLDFWRERAFGFMHLGAAAWLGEWLTSSLFTVVAGLIVTEIAYAWLAPGWGGRGRRPGVGVSGTGGEAAVGPAPTKLARGAASGAGPAPKRWWLKMWVVVAVAIVVAVALQPVLIAPQFNRFEPVQDPAVRSALEGLAARAGIPHAHIYEMNASRQSGHTNAYVVGLLGSQRIVVYDTLLAQQTLPEVEFTVGHEIGHYVRNHLWKGVGFTLALLLGFFALLGWLYPKWSGGVPPTDVAGLPLLLLLLLGLLFLAQPATNGFSRWEEHQADAYGLRLSQQPCAAVTGFEREEHSDLIYPDPPRWVVLWFFNHPSQQARIAFAGRACAVVSGPRARNGG